MEYIATTTGVPVPELNMAPWNDEWQQHSGNYKSWWEHDTGKKDDGILHIKALLGTLQLAGELIFTAKCYLSSTRV